MILILSIVISIIIWSLLNGLKFALILIGSIFIHEYGHYYWMGREGIKNRGILFIPPFGAMAMAKEMWPSRGAEARISLAGPIFGIISVLVFLILWLWTNQLIFAASVVLASYINLFNLLLPVAILDGGRVIKSIFFSINTTLGESLFLIGFALLASMVIFTPIMNPLFVVIIGFMLWQDYSQYRYAKQTLPKIRKTLSYIESILSNSKHSENDNKQTLNNAVKLIVQTLDYENLDTMKKHEKDLKLLLNPPSMTYEEIIKNVAIFIVITMTYLSMIEIMGSYVDLKLYTLHQYFK